MSNGTPLPLETIYAEEAAGPYTGGAPAGEVGPPPDVIRSHLGPGHVQDGVLWSQRLHRLPRGAEVPGGGRGGGSGSEDPGLLLCRSSF